MAVITGDNSGIGLAATQEFIEQGAKVAIFGRNAATLAEAAEQVGSNVLAIQGEVTQVADLECLFRKTETKAVAFLVSPDSSFIVGTEVVADGG